MTQITLETVLHKFCEDPNISENQQSMTRTSIEYVLVANGVSSAFDIKASQIHKSVYRLKRYLKKERPDLSTNTKRNYLSFYRRFIKWGVKNEYIPKKIENKLSSVWAIVAPLIPDDTAQRKGWRSGFRKFGFWCSSMGYTPIQITIEILKDFMYYLQYESQLKHWRITYTGARKDWLAQSKVGTLPIIEWPPLPSSVRSTYFFPLKEWPIAMQKIYHAYRLWCTQLFVPDRDKKYKQKEISADKNLQLLEQIAGYCVNIRNFPKSELSFDIFFKRDVISGYLNWMVTERLNGKQTPTLQRMIGVLLGMVRGYFKAQYKNNETWLQQLLDGMDTIYVRNLKELLVTEEEIQRTADGIKKSRIQLLHDSYKHNRSPSARTVAHLVEYELIIRFLGARPLRSKNLRELQLQKSLFLNNKGILWLEFEKDETKAKNIIDFKFPPDLIDLLWEYLEIYRPILLNGYDTEWVFPSLNGSHICDGTVRNIVRKSFKKYTGKHVFPHLLRHSVVYNYLKKNPGDFLTPQKMLGHANLETTLRIYGHFEAEDAADRFDEFRLKLTKNNSEKGEE